MKNKDLHRTNYALKRTSHQGLRTIFLLILFLIVLGAGGALLKYSQLLSSSYFIRIKTFISAHRNLRHDLTKVQQLATGGPAEDKPLHFEFYNTLPNMQFNIPKTSTTIPAKKISQSKKKKANRIVVDAQEIEKEFANELKRKT